MTKRRIQISLSMIFGRSRYYWLDLDTGALQPQSAEDLKDPPVGSLERAMQTRGNLRRFGVGGSIVLFRDDKDHFIQIGRHRWKLGEPKLWLTHHHIGPIGIFVVKAETFRRTFVEWRLGAAISKVVDPTYDYLDSVMDDFACEVIGLHKAALKGP